MYGSSSLLSYLGVKLADTTLQTVESNASYGYEKVGFAKSLISILKMTEIAIKSDSLGGIDTNATLWTSRFKNYVYKCALMAGLARNPEVLKYIKNPSVDIMDAIKPANLGLTDDDKITDIKDGNETTCSDYYSNYLTDSDDASKSYLKNADLLLEKINKALKSYLSTHLFISSTSLTPTPIISNLKQLKFHNILCLIF